jgi:hypothetical protein
MTCLYFIFYLRSVLACPVSTAFPGVFFFLKSVLACLLKSVLACPASTSIPGVLKDSERSYTMIQCSWIY